MQDDILGYLIKFKKSKIEIGVFWEFWVENRQKTTFFEIFRYLALYIYIHIGFET